MQPALKYDFVCFCRSLLSGRISSLKDESGAIFIDRDPDAFVPILNFLRTKELDLRGLDPRVIKHEAEYYGITPLVRRLLLCDDLARSQCGDLLFHGYLNVPELPTGLGDPSSNSRRGSVSSMISPSPSNSNFTSIRGAVSEPNLKFDGVDPQKVLLITAHHSWIAVAYVHCVCCYWMRDSHGWQHVFTSPYMEESIEKIALNTKMPGSQGDKMVAVASGSKIWLWSCGQGQGNRIGVFDLTVMFDHLFFVGSQLVALSHRGKIGVWHAVTQHWQIQDVVPVKSYDAAGSFLLLGGADGSIYYVGVKGMYDLIAHGALQAANILQPVKSNMEKFPLRMKDNDLLVTELFRDPNGDAITALSVYLTPRTCLSGTWIEIAYGTSSGTVRVIVHHPETVSSGPQLFQTFTCHRTAVTKVALSEKHLVSICSEYNHVRTWSVTRFRGMISTQPGPTPLSSFNVVSIEQGQPRPGQIVGNSIGPYGERDDQQVFVQKVVPDTDQAYLRLASNGKRLCTIKSVDGSRITAFYVHECDGSTRMASRQRRFLFSGHSNGSIQLLHRPRESETACIDPFQKCYRLVHNGGFPKFEALYCSPNMIWDLTTAMEGVAKHPDSYSMAGPNDEELLKLLEQCDLRASRSRSTTPCASLSPGSSMLSTNINNHRFGISNYSLTTSGGGPSIENSLDQRDPEIPTFNPRIPISYGRQVSIGRTYAPRDISEAVQQQPLSAARSRVTEEKEATKNAVTTDC